MQLKTPDGHVVFDYVTRKPENIGLTSPSAAYFDPVNTPSGERVTNAAPDVLRYRVVTHDGPAPTDVLQKLAVEWRGMQGNPFSQ